MRNLSEQEGLDARWAGVRTSWAEALTVVTGQYSPTCEEERRSTRSGASKTERDEKEKIREKRRLLKAGDLLQRVGQGCCWRSQRRAENQRG